MKQNLEDKVLHRAGLVEFSLGCSYIALTPSAYIRFTPEGVFLGGFVTLPTKVDYGSWYSPV